MAEQKKQGKEQAIYEGVLALVATGRPLHEITVQQIANAAHIGKGTVYEYFASREEIFEKIVGYRVEQELAGLQALMDEKETDFLQKLDCLFVMLEEAVRSKSSSLQLVFSNLQSPSVQRAMSAPCPACAQLHARQTQLLQAFLQHGVAQGFLEEKAVRRYGMLAVNGCIMAYASAVLAPDSPQNTAQLRADTKALLLQALRPDTTK